jgi:hypothetical protein
LHCDVWQGSLDEEPAALFFGHQSGNGTKLLRDVALYAYHASVEWGIVTNFVETLIFNSHWIKGRDWFVLPAIPSDRLMDQADILAALQPEGIIRGEIDRVANQLIEPDEQLIPVDDALVDRLDTWRAEAARYAPTTNGLDEKIHNLFAQLFVLRAVEDRRLCPRLQRLEGTLSPEGPVDVSLLEGLFREARETIQSELFDTAVPREIPPFVLGGIIRDLYKPAHLPFSDARYNFAWIDADVLGRAYEKYLSTVFVPARALAAQLPLWGERARGVERTTRRKASGVYYTPSYIVHYLTQKCLHEYFAGAGGRAEQPPRVADTACGSGSFLTAAVDRIIRHLRLKDNRRNWGRELVEGQRIIGIDIDPKAVTLARLSLWLRLAEEPDPLPLPRLNEIVVCGDSLDPDTWSKLPDEYDIILGNPPFIAAGKVESRQRLGERFRTAQGRFDYSYLFVELAVSKLADRGVMGLVVPNRVFRNRDAATLRQILVEQTRLLTLADFGSTEVFAGTSSYVGLLVTRKMAAASAQEGLRFLSVRDVPIRFAAVLLAIADEGDPPQWVHIAAYRASVPTTGDPWAFLSPSAQAARVRLADMSDPLSSIAEIFQGIKTGANDVFVVEADVRAAGPACLVRNSLGDSHFVEKACLRPVVYGSEIQRYDIVSPIRFLVFPYVNDDVITESVLEREYPETYKYLSMYRALLGQRTSIIVSRRNWYELVRNRRQTWLQSGKLLSRDMATEPSFAVDEAGSTYLVGGTAVVPADVAQLRPLLGYLNSRVAGRYLEQITPGFRSGFQKIEPRHLEELPVPRRLIGDAELSGRVADLVQGIIDARREEDVAGQRRLESALDALICQMVGLDADEVR